MLKSDLCDYSDVYKGTTIVANTGTAAPQIIKKKSNI